MVWRHGYNQKISTSLLVKKRAEQILVRPKAGTVLQFLSYYTGEGVCLEVKLTQHSISSVKSENTIVTTYKPKCGIWQIQVYKVGEMIWWSVSGCSPHKHGGSSAPCHSLCGTCHEESLNVTKSFLRQSLTLYPWLASNSEICLLGVLGLKVSAPSPASLLHCFNQRNLHLPPYQGKNVGNYHRTSPLHQAGNENQVWVSYEGRGRSSCLCLVFKLQSGRGKEEFRKYIDLKREESGHGDGSAVEALAVQAWEPELNSKSQVWWPSVILAASL